jgi:hypothetical protein
MMDISQWQLNAFWTPSLKMAAIIGATIYEIPSYGCNSKSERWIVNL